MSTDLFLVTDIPVPDFASGRHHAGVDCLLDLLASHGLALYRSTRGGPLASPQGLIDAEDVVLLKVNAQWKFRGCTNSDVLRGLIQCLLEHPDGFRGEIVIFDNAQGQGSMDGTPLAWGRYGEDHSVLANAENPLHSFAWLADTAFGGQGVSTYLLDGIREAVIANDDHLTDGYRIWEGLSYPCFTTRGGRRVELREGLWNGQRYEPRVKLINVPVLKTHAEAWITACLKSSYGILSMGRPERDYHYGEAGRVWGEMLARVRMPTLNILDCTWVSLRNHYGFPACNTSRLNRLLAGTDPVALDYWASKYIVYPLSGLANQHPDRRGPEGEALLATLLIQGRDTINQYGGIAGLPATLDEEQMNLFVARP